MKVNAWIQMGCERREVTFDVSEAEIEKFGEAELEGYIETKILDWIDCRYGWGWSCDRITNDFSFLEDMNSPSLVVTSEILNPRTERRVVDLPQHELGSAPGR